MEVAILQIGALGILGYFVYKATSMSMKPMKAQMIATKAGDIGEFAQYDETSNAAVDQLKYRADKTYSKVIKREDGEFGVPRTIYQGTGSVITAYGDNFNSC